MRLRHQDWKRLFQAVAELYSDFDPDNLQERTIKALNSMIAGEIAAFDFFTEDGVHTGEMWHDPVGSISGTQYKIFAEVARDHPFSEEIFSKSKYRTLMTSDFVTETGFKDSRVFREFYGLFPIHNQLLLSINPVEGLVVTCTINRRAKGFNEVQRTMMDLFAPHISNAVRNDRKLRRLFAASRGFENFLSDRSIGVMVLDDGLRIISSNHRSEELLSNYFDFGSSTHAGLPDELRNWLQGNDVSPTSHQILTKTPSKTVSAASSLSVTVIYDHSNRERVLLLEESKQPSPDDLRPLGLTKRQSEVLFLLGQGKTDKDIGELLGISHRTVHKHLESIYVRLGVETRTAAMRCAIEFVK